MSVEELVAEARKVLRPVVDMHAEVFRPGKPTNRDRLFLFVIKNLGALLDSIATLTAERDAAVRELGRQRLAIADFVEERLDWDRSSDQALYAIAEAIRNPPAKLIAAVDGLETST